METFGGDSLQSFIKEATGLFPAHTRGGIRGFNHFPQFPPLIKQVKIATVVGMTCKVTISS